MELANNVAMGVGYFFMALMVVSVIAYGSREVRWRWQAWANLRYLKSPAGLADQLEQAARREELRKEGRVTTWPPGNPQDHQKPPTVG